MPGHLVVLHWGNTLCMIGAEVFEDRALCFGRILLEGRS